MNTNSISKVFLVLLVTLWPNQILAQNLISSACDHNMFKELCTKTLGSDSESTAATNFESLAKVALKHATSAATHIHDKVTKLIEGSLSHLEQGPLTDCNANFQDAIEQLTKSGNALASKKYNDVNTWVLAAMSAGDSCEQGYKGAGIESPISSEGTSFTQLCSIALAITNQLK